MLVERTWRSWVQLLHGGELVRVGFPGGRFRQERDMVSPFEPCRVDQGGTADGDFADVVWEGGARTNSAQKRVPACFR